jgi:hypothetical protein
VRTIRSKASTPRRSYLRASRKLLMLALIAAAVLLAAAPSAFALFANGGFENGNLTSWTRSSFLNPGLTLPEPFTGDSIVRDSGGSNLTQLRGPFATMSQTDANTGGLLHFPLAGSYCAVVNFEGKNGNGNSLLQQSTTTAADVAPDGKIHVQFAWAAVVQNPAHIDVQQPYVYVALWNVTKGRLLYETFHFAGVGAIWQNAGNSVQFTDWQATDIASDPADLAVGDRVEIETVAAGCSLGGHWGYLYVDRFGAFTPVTPHVTIAAKSFDGTTTAAITGRSLDGVQPGDDVSLTGGTATFDSAAAGPGRPATVTGLSLTGADADRYMLTFFSTTASADITESTPPTTTATGLVANDHSSWQKTAGPVTLTATDGVGWGVAAIHYTLDGGPTQTYANGSPIRVTASGPHEVRYWAVDLLGNRETPHTGYVNIDDEAPNTIALGVDPLPMSWHNTAQDVTLVPGDGAGSGIAATYYGIDGAGFVPYTGPFTISTTGDHVVSYYSVDNVGNTELTHTGSVRVDVTPPVTTATGLSAGAGTWTSAAATVALETTDDSGIDASYYTVDGGGPQLYEGSFTISAEGPHTVTYWSVDTVGNVEAPSKIGHVNIDITKPATTATGIAAGAGDLIVGDAQSVTLTAVDGSGAGIASTSYTVDGGKPQSYGPTGFTISGEGPHAVSYWSLDKAGNSEDPKTGYVTIDTTAPVTTAGGLVGNQTTWVATSQLVTLLADAGAGAELGATYYTVDAGEPVTYDGPFTVSGEGHHTITYWSVDTIGNAEALKTGFVNIDLTKPVTTAKGIDGSGTLRVADAVPVTLTATDGAGSGIASTHYTVDGGAPQTYDGPFTISAEGPHTVTFWSLDKVGNLEEAGLGSVIIDMTAPVTAATGVQADDHSGAVAYKQTVTLTVTDASPIAATYYTVDGGPQQTYAEPFTVKGTGSHAITYWSVDVLDNAEAAHAGFVNIAAPGAIVTTATGLSGDDRSGWTNTARTVTLTASGGWGALTTYYTVDGGAPQTYAAPFQISAEGSHLVAYWSEDQEPAAENHNTGYANLDMTPPVTHAEASDAWRNTTVVVPTTALDSGSGVADTFYRVDGGALQTSATITVPAPADHTMDGTRVVSYFSTDKAGNVEVAKTQPVRIDTIRPRIQLKKTLFTWHHGRTARVKFRVTDATVTEVDVQLRVTQYGGPQSKVYKLGLKKCGRWYVASFKCMLPAHRYNLHMRAIDYARNLGGKAGLIIIRK